MWITSRMETPPSFHISLLKRWNESEFVQEPTHIEVDELEVPGGTMYEVERVLWWRERRMKNRTIREFLTVWIGFPLEDASWELEDNFSDKKQLQEDIDAGLIIEDK